MSLPPQVVPVIGIASVVLGVFEASSAGFSALMAPVNIGVGGVVMVVYLVGTSFLRIAENRLDMLGEKVISLPTAEQLAEDKKSLFEKLEHLGDEADKERRAMASFRENLAATLANHGARITSLENKTG